MRYTGRKENLVGLTKCIQVKGLDLQTDTDHNLQIHNISLTSLSLALSVSSILRIHLPPVALAYK